MITSGPAPLRLHGPPAGAATRDEALQRLRSARPGDYARTRNRLGGAVTGLSPYLTHGVLTLPEVLAHLQQAHAVRADDKLVFELGWREFFRHVWRHEGNGILHSLHTGPLPDDAYAQRLPDDVRHACTGLPVVDQAVRALYATGMLHNHARMWLASYLVHLRRVHWRTGADWMVGHLLDGDLASNHLSWQWVAGTASHKPYLFNAENVRRHAPPEWHVDGSVLDDSYEAIDALIRRAPAHTDTAVRRKAAAASSGDTGSAAPMAWGGIDEPACTSAPPPDAGFTTPDGATVAGRDVWLVHAWCLQTPPPGLLPVAVLDSGFHARWPWSAKRWSFVTEAMKALAPVRWLASADELRRALAPAQRIHGVFDPHLGGIAGDAGLAVAGEAHVPARQANDAASLHGAPPTLRLAHAPAIWPEPGRRQRSFSAWWTRVQRHTPRPQPLAQGDLFDA